jgi:hypothetical protein
MRNFKQPNRLANETCPLCGKDNQCGVKNNDCWCFFTKVPMELREQIPAEKRGEACICQKCVEQFIGRA